MLKFILGFFVALILTATLGICNAEWKQELKQDLDGCVVKNVQYSNAFAEVQMVCNYFDGVVVGVAQQTLFVSPKGYVIKWGW